MSSLVKATWLHMLAGLRGGFALTAAVAAVSQSSSWILKGNQAKEAAWAPLTGMELKNKHVNDSIIS